MMGGVVDLGKIGLCPPCRWDTPHIYGLIPITSSNMFITAVTAISGKDQHLMTSKYLNIKVDWKRWYQRLSIGEWWWLQSTSSPMLVVEPTPASDNHLSAVSCTATLVYNTSSSSSPSSSSAAADSGGLENSAAYQQGGVEPRWPLWCWSWFESWILMCMAHRNTHKKELLW